MADTARIERIRKRMADRLDLYAKKNEMYGDAFSKTFQAYGPISALTRMRDKLDRLETLILNPQLDPKDETILDTLTDLANYCDMTIEAMAEMPAPVEEPAPKAEKKPRKKRKPKAEKKEKASPLDNMPKEKLLAIAKQLNLATSNKTSKAVLIAMIEKAFDTEADLIQYLESQAEDIK